MIDMSIPTLIIDKTTVANVVSGLVVLAYVGFMGLYPTIAPPSGLEKLAFMAITYLLTTSSVAIGQKLAQQKNQ